MGKAKQANVEKWWGSKKKGGNLKILMFYNLTLVFDDVRLFGSRKGRSQAWLPATCLERLGG